MRHSWESGFRDHRERHRDRARRERRGRRERGVARGVADVSPAGVRRGRRQWTRPSVVERRTRWRRADDLSSPDSDDVLLLRRRSRGADARSELGGRAHGGRRRGRGDERVR